MRVAADLAANPTRLAEIRANLRGEVQRSPLLDHAAQSARFGTALRACWQEWCAALGQHRDLSLEFRG